MRRKFLLGVSGLLAAAALATGALVAVGFPGNAAAQDPSPPSGMHKACENMSPEAMDGMHQGMMSAGGQMAQWMASGDHCPNQRWR